jgi:cytochrome c peroxidase
MAAIIPLLTMAMASPPIHAADADKPMAPDELALMLGDLLGKRLFEDKNLSEPRGLACASCHDARAAYQGNNHSPVPALARGSRPGALGTRKTPSLLYAMRSPPFSFATRKNDVTGLPEIVPVGGQFRDGRADDLAAQVEGPLLDKREMNNPSREAVVAKVRAGAYASLARDVFGDDLFDDTNKAFDKLAAAVASYEATARFRPFSSKFDDWLEGRALLSPREARGFDLFKDPKKGNCLSCHDGGTPGGDDGEGPTGVVTGLSRNPKDWLFTDFTYDVLGAPRNPRIPDNANPAHFDLGLCEKPRLAAYAPAGFDLENLCGAFKVPTLRNVAITAPYMHNGVFKTLREGVAFYFTRDTNPERWYPKSADGRVEKFNDLPPVHHRNVNARQAPYDRKPGEAPRATDAEIDDIVAFLKTLTDRPAR